ncbi:MAG: hypothetical protein JKY70_17295 [Mucilaginibacter sp.]|nr:hypothetical protein [Mucilaginibacter sp.]
MKKILAIAMLFVLLFNMGGYMLLFQYCLKASDDFANEQISKGFYRPDELVEIKIPVRMPYVQEQLQYENISGQIQLQGNCYNYVALKMTRDTMYVKCVPNYAKTKLISQNIINAKEISDSPLAKKNRASSLKKTGTDNDFNYAVTIFNILSPFKTQEKPFVKDNNRFSESHLSSPAQPPEVLS